jgi:hypothetical protein
MGRRNSIEIVTQQHLQRKLYHNSIYKKPLRDNIQENYCATIFEKNRCATISEKLLCDNKIYATKIAMQLYFGYFERNIMLRQKRLTIGIDTIFFDFPRFYLFFRFILIFQASSYYAILYSMESG